MAGQVIQGFFIGGAMRPQPAAQAGRRQATGAPARAFAGRAAPPLPCPGARRRPPRRLLGWGVAGAWC